MACHIVWADPSLRSILQVAGRLNNPRGEGACSDIGRWLSPVWPVGTPPRWPSGKASASRAEDPGFESRLPRKLFRGRVIPVSQKLTLQWLLCQAPGVIGSALGLVGPVSVYCDLVSWKVGSASSISVWLHVKLSEQIRPNKQQQPVGTGLYTTT